MKKAFYKTIAMSLILSNHALAQQRDSWITFTTADGLANNRVNAIHESRDGALWFGTRGGVSRLKSDKSPPFTFINKKPEKIIETSTTFFTFSGRDFRTPLEQLFYSYTILKGSMTPDSSHWQPFSKATSAEIRSLENGTHIFYVRARDEWGNIDPAPASWTFTVDITQPTVTINSPSADGVVAGQVAIVGSAFDSSPLRDFKNYQLSYGYGTIVRASLSGKLIDLHTRLLRKKFAMIR